MLGKNNSNCNHKKETSNLTGRKKKTSAWKERHWFLAYPPGAQEFKTGKDLKNPLGQVNTGFWVCEKLEK